MATPPRGPAKSERRAGSAQSPAKAGSGNSLGKLLLVALAVAAVAFLVVRRRSATRTKAPTPVSSAQSPEDVAKLPRTTRDNRIIKEQEQVYANMGAASGKAMQEFERQIPREQQQRLLKLMEKMSTLPPKSPESLRLQAELRRELSRPNVKKGIADWNAAGRSAGRAARAEAVKAGAGGKP